MSYSSDVSIEDADYKTWRKIDLWQVQEGICLLLGVEPKSGLFICRERHEYNALEFWKEFDEIAKMVERSIDSGVLKIIKWVPNILFCELPPSAFLQWAKNKEFEIHESLVNLLTDNESQSLNTDARNEKEIQETQSDLIEKKLRPSQATKRICQVIALTLWDIYPDMTIEDMKDHKAILEYGGGNYYSGKNTLRDWLSEVDPRPLEVKTGRPRNK